MFFGYLFCQHSPKKHRNFDTMGIKIAVLSFCPKALISREFGLLRILLMPSRSIAHRQSAPRRYRMTAGYRLFLGLPFNLWAIVYLYLTSDNLPYEKIGDNELLALPTRYRLIYPIPGNGCGWGAFRPTQKLSRK